MRLDCTANRHPHRGDPCQPPGPRPRPGGDAAASKHRPPAHKNVGTAPPLGLVLVVFVWPGVPFPPLPARLPRRRSPLARGPIPAPRNGIDRLECDRLTQRKRLHAQPATGHHKQSQSLSDTTARRGRCVGLSCPALPFGHVIRRPGVARPRRGGGSCPHQTRRHQEQVVCDYLADNWDLALDHAPRASTVVRSAAGGDVRLGHKGCPHRSFMSGYFCGAAPFDIGPYRIIVILVIELTMCVEGGFAQIYYEMSAHSPHSVDPYPLSGIDAAYFTISTATTSGIGDIHPVSGAARLLVSAQMIANVYLVVVAITTAVQRARPRDDRATLERHLANDERTRASRPNPVPRQRTQPGKRGQFSVKLAAFVQQRIHRPMDGTLHRPSRHAPSAASSRQLRVDDC